MPSTRAFSPPPFPPPTAAQPLNRLREPSRLGAQQLARWKGLPLGWFDAEDGARTSGVHVQRPMLALLETGHARATFSAGGRSRELDIGGGAMGLFTPDQPSHDSLWHCQGARRIIVDIDVERIGGFVDTDLFERPLKAQLEIYDDGLAGVMRAMVEEVDDGCPHGALYAESLSLGLALRLWQRHASHAGGGAARERGRLSAAQLGRVDEVVEAGLGGTVTLAAMAAAAGFSKAHFVRLFRNTRGCSPHAHVLSRRVERARTLIEHTSLPLAQVAAEAGFSGQSHLNDVFLRRLGTTPGRLRREALR